MSQQGPDPFRPIFADPPDTLGMDEHHYGHLLAAGGGMETIELARTFAEAGHLLLAHAREHGKTWEAAPPILYCYRHALELYLKALTGPVRLNHDLQTPWAALHDRIRGRFQGDHLAWLADRVREFQAVDPRSMTFRYPDAHPSNIDPELWVDFRHLGSQASRLFSAMETIRLHLNVQDRAP